MAISLLFLRFSVHVKYMLTLPMLFSFIRHSLWQQFFGLFLNEFVIYHCGTISVISVDIT
jgi:hypothetical protein